LITLEESREIGPVLTGEKIHSKVASYGTLTLSERLYIWEY
jgi:hypothetical protein